MCIHSSVGMWRPYARPTVVIAGRFTHTATRTMRQIHYVQQASGIQQ